MAGGATFLPGRAGIYRNAWRKGTEEVRSIIQKTASKYSANVQDWMVTACDDFVDTYVDQEGSGIPVKTGNLVDSFGVALYKNDTLYHLSHPVPRATKRVRAGVETFEGLGGYSAYGNPYWLVSGITELNLMTDNVNLPNRTIVKHFADATRTYEGGMVTALMFIAAPYARLVPEKGYWGGTPGVPRNDYYEAIEYGFASLARDLKQGFKL